MCDEPRVWAELGFDVNDDAVFLGRVLIRLGSSARADAGGGAGDGGRGIAGWSLRGVSSAELDGLNTTVSQSPPREPAAAQPNGVLALDHVVAFSPDFERTLRSLQTAGLDLRRVREEPTPAGAPRQAFFRLGEDILELIELPEDRLAVAGGREAPARLVGARVHGRGSRALRGEPRGTRERDPRGGAAGPADRDVAPRGGPVGAGGADDPAGGDGAVSDAAASARELWTDVDSYTADLLVREDEALRNAAAASVAAGLPQIAVTPNQGKLLHLLVRMLGARSILELGTLGGYSTIWLARALPADGRLVTLEIEPDYARVAGESIERAGVSDRVEQRVGAALDSLRSLAGEGAGPFDFTFIDADKKSMPEYFEWALELSHPGSVIVADNVVRGGTLLEPAGDPHSEGVRRFHELLSAAPGTTATTIQTVGAKGYDGFTLVLVEPRP